MMVHVYSCGYRGMFLICAIRFYSVAKYKCYIFITLYYISAKMMYTPNCCPVEKQMGTECDLNALVSDGDVLLI